MTWHTTQCSCSPGQENKIIMNESDLKIGETYRLESGNEFVLICDYHPNVLCFRRKSDGQMHFGREFINFLNGKRIIELEKIKQKDEKWLQII